MIYKIGDRVRQTVDQGEHLVAPHYRAGSIGTIRFIEEGVPLPLHVEFDLYSGIEVRRPLNEVEPVNTIES